MRIFWNYMKFSPFNDELNWFSVLHMHESNVKAISDSYIR